MSNVATPDFGEFVAGSAGYGVLPDTDLGQYAAGSVGAGVVPDVDLGQYAAVTTGFGVTPDIDVGEFSDVVSGFGVLPKVRMGEIVDYAMDGAGGALGYGVAYTVGDPLIALDAAGGALGSGAADVQAVLLSITQYYMVGGSAGGGGNTLVATEWREHYPTGGALGSGSGWPAQQSGTLSASLPKLTVTLSGTSGISGTLTLRLPMLSGTLGGESGTSSMLAGRLPLLTSSLKGGDYALLGQLPALTGSISARSGLVGALSARLPVLTASLRGVVTQSGSITGILPALRGVALSRAGVLGTLDARLSRLRAGLQGLSGTFGTLTARLPAPEGALTGSEVVSAQLGAQLPGMQAAFSAPGPAGLVAAAYVMNTSTFALTEYASYEFNSFAVWQGIPLAAGDDGLYELDSGTTDGADAIVARLKTPLLDLGSDQLKRLSDFYAWMRAEQDVTLYVSTDEGAVSQVVLPRTTDGKLRARRAIMPKGLRGTYWQFELVTSGNIEFDKLLVSAGHVGRRVGT